MDFESLVANYAEEYDSTRALAEELKQEATQKAEIQGSELVNIVGAGGISMLGKAITRAGISGKITKTLDDYEGKMSPMGARAFRIARQVGSDLVGSAGGHGKVGSVVKSLGIQDALKPTNRTDSESNVVEQPTEEEAAATEPEADDSWKISVANEIAPALRAVGRDDLADQAIAEHESGHISRATASQAHEVLSQADDENSQAVAAKMVSSYQQAKIRAGRATATDNPEPAEEAVVRPTEPVAGSTQPVVERAQDTLSATPAPTVVSSQTFTRSGGEETVFTGGGQPIRPDVQPDTEFGDAPANAFSAVTQIVGLAGGNMSGAAGEGLRLGALGAQTAAELAQLQVPAGAIIAGVQEGLAQLGPRGVEAGQGIGLAATTASVARAGQAIYGLAANAVRGAVGAGEQAATQIGAAAANAPATLTGGAVQAASDAAGAVAGGAVAGGEGGGTGVLSTLGALTEGSAAGDEDPIGIAITAGLGLITGLVGLGEGIKDLFESHHAPSLPKPAMPSFQAGVQG